MAGVIVMSYGARDMSQITACWRGNLAQIIQRQRQTRLCTCRAISKDAYRCTVLNHFLFQEVQRLLISFQE